MTITGTNLTGASEVKFGSAKASALKAESATQVTATSPAGSGTVHVTVSTPGGTSATSAADEYTYIPAPTVTKVEPTSGPAAGASTVTITGTNLTGASEVKFGANAATGVKAESATQGHRDLPGRLGHGARDREHPRRHERHGLGRRVHLHPGPDGQRKSNRRAARPPVRPP